LGEKIAAHLGCAVHFWDERLSTVAAERALLEANMRRSRRKQVINHVAAALILQGWLDCRSSQRARNTPKDTHDE
jgi:putative Holliday junction resolvase